MKKYYFASEIRGIVGEHSGNIRGAKAKAQKLAEQLDEEITIFVRSNKEIDCGKNIPANEEVCRVCNADGDVLAVCSTYGNAFAWCAENGIEGEIGEYEPYIEVGTYSENGNFEVEDYSSINTGDGMWNIINDYCYYFDKVCPEATAETVESVEETTVSETETVEETAEQEETEVKTKMYWAAVRNKETNQLEVIKRDDYSSKKDFAHDLRANGYAVRFISTPDKFDEDCENYYWECEKRQNVRKCVSESKERMEIAEQETELNAEVVEVEAEQTAEPETFSKSKSESEPEPTAENITVSGTNQGNINVLIVADVINTFKMITHTGYFDTS